MGQDYIEVENSGYFIGANMIFDLDISAYAKLLYLYLTKMGNGQKSSFPSYRTIARYCGFSKRTAIRAMEELIDSGLVLKQVRRRGTTYTSNVYKVLIKPVGEVKHIEKTNSKISNELLETNEKDRLTVIHKRKTETPPAPVDEPPIKGSDSQTLGGVFDLVGGDSQSLGGGDTETLGGDTQTPGGDSQSLIELVPKELVPKELNNNSLSFNPSIYPSINQSKTALKISSNRDLYQVKKQIEAKVLELDYDGDEVKLSLVKLIQEIMSETYEDQSPCITISGKQVETPKVIERFEKITMSHVKYICESIDQTQKSIRNVKEYIKTSLYNAPVTMSLFYNQQIKQDMKDMMT